MDNFKGYYIKVNGCDFRNPQLSKFNYSPALVQVTDAGVVASGKLKIKVLPHTRRTIDCGFPPLTPAQFRVYWAALKGDDAGKGMYLSIQVWDDSKNAYITDTFYHNDLTYDTIIVNGERWLKIHDFQLIGH